MNEPKISFAGASILIVDDEAHIRAPLRRALELQGYHVDDVGSGQEALARLAHSCPDVMVLDMRMPGMSGIEVIEQCHQVAPQVVIIVLTGHATIESAVAAVKAEEVMDYLLKPASIQEVSDAIAQALQRRAQRVEQQRLLDAVFRAVEGVRRSQEAAHQPVAMLEEAPPAAVKIDHQMRLAFLEENPAEPIELTDGEMAVLDVLLANRGTVLSCKEIAHAAWGYEVSEVEAQGPVRPIIFRLRRKLERSPSEPRLIQTVRGRGYFLSVGDN